MEKDRAFRLAQLLVSKTIGNPFFLIRYLKRLYDEEVLRFDGEAGTWVYNEEKAATMEVAENAAQLMTLELKQLDPKVPPFYPMELFFPFIHFVSFVNRCSWVLALQANSPRRTWRRQKTPPRRRSAISCNGPWIARSSTSSDHRFTRYAHLLCILLKRAFFFFLKNQFCHDHVRSAAYSLLSEQQRQEYHLKIAHLMRASFTAEGLVERIFDYVEHLKWYTCFYIDNFLLIKFILLVETLSSRMQTNFNKSPNSL